MGLVKELAKSMGRGYFVVARRAGELGIAAHPAEKVFARKIKDENHARSIFDKFKKCGLGLLQFCAKFGFDDDTMRRHIAARWPDEWDAVIESKAPRQTKYRLGRAFEYHVRDLFRKKGYFVLRSPRSGSPVDLVALKTGRVVFIQCKRGGAIGVKEWNIFFSLAISVGAVPVLAERPTGRGIDLWEMNDQKDGSRKPQPRTEFLP